MPKRIYALLALCVICMTIGLGMAVFVSHELRNTTAIHAKCTDILRRCTEGLACLKRETD